MWNPTPEEWRGEVGIEAALADAEGLELARSDTALSVHAIASGGSSTISQRALAPVRLVDEATGMRLRLTAGIDCPQVVGYDSLVALVGEKEAKARRENWSGDMPCFGEWKAQSHVDASKVEGSPYCYGGRSDEVVVSVGH